MAKFQAINWSPSEVIGDAKMDQMTENTEWLFRNTPRAIYTLPGGFRRTEGIKIASGRVIITKRSSDQATAQVRFGNFFANRCEPIITVGVVSAQQPRIFHALRGIGNNIPDARGFEVTINVDAGAKKNDKIASTMYVNWTAVGY